MKIAIIGAGSVGATAAYAMLINGLASELVLVDVNRAKAHAEVLDLNHGMMFMPPAKVYEGEYGDCAASGIVVITAGAKQKEGQTRLDLARVNTEILKDMMPRLIKVVPDAIYLMVTNPVDVLTYVAIKISGLPWRRVLGSGTVLDTSRFRYLLGRHCGISVRNAHGYIVGEHGDSEVPLWSGVTMGGVKMEDYCLGCIERGRCDDSMKDEIYTSVRDSAYQIIEAKGATYYAIGLTAARIIEAIGRDERRILTVTSLLDDYLGISDVCLSVPTVIDAQGCEAHIPVRMTDKELAAFRHSAEVVKSAIRSVGF